MPKFSSFLFPLCFISIIITACAPSAALPTNVASATPNIIIPTPPACTTLLAEQTPGPDSPSIFPAESKTDHVRGAQDPTLTIMAYSDYQDLRSGLFEEVTNRLLEERPNDVRVVSRIFPLVKIN